MGVGTGAVTCIRLDGETMDPEAGDGTGPVACVGSDGGAAMVPVTVVVAIGTPVVAPLLYDMIVSVSVNVTVLQPGGSGPVGAAPAISPEPAGNSSPQNGFMGSHTVLSPRSDSHWQYIWVIK